ncbi:MAG: SPOR domain-containing protein [Pseudomonadota bacterium]
MLKRSCAVLLSLLGATSYADLYDVQIGAFRNPNPAVTVSPDIGELRHTVGNDGLTRVLVGPYASKSDANRARDALRAAGFGQAYIRTASTAAAVIPSSTSHVDDVMPDPDAMTADDMELEGERVMLDGKPHRKVGDRFIPIK